MNPWNYKPWWCQPWSILLTGVAIVGATWILWKTVWATVLISLPVLAWMSFFLIVWPQLMMRQSGQPTQYPQPTPNDTKEAKS